MKPAESAPRGRKRPAAGGKPARKARPVTSPGPGLGARERGRQRPPAEPRRDSPQPVAPRGRTPAPPAPGKTPREARIERAVAFLNARARSIGQEILAIGTYLLREFFDDDPEAVARRDSGKMTSLRELAARDDLLLSYTTLRRAVYVALQERRLGLLPALRRLTPSHRIELLAVDGVGEKRKLATRAAAKGWSVRDLHKVIRERKNRPAAAPARTPPARDALSGVETSLRRIAAKKSRDALAPAAVAALPAERRRRVTRLVRRALAALSKIAGGLPEARRKGGRRPRASR